MSPIQTSLHYFQSETCSHLHPGVGWACRICSESRPEGVVIVVWSSILLDSGRNTLRNSWAWLMHSPWRRQSWQEKLSISLVEVIEVVKKLHSGTTLGVNETGPAMHKALGIVGLGLLATSLSAGGWTQSLWIGSLVWLQMSEYHIAQPPLEKLTPGCWKRRLCPIAELQIQEEQCGFHPVYGTVDELFTLARILKGSYEFAHPVYMCFVDRLRPCPFGYLEGDIAGVRGTRALTMNHAVLE